MYVLEDSEEGRLGVDRIRENGYGGDCNLSQDCLEE